MKLESIYSNESKSTSFESSNFYGETHDTIMLLEDNRLGIESILILSSKSQFTSEATLFNASGDNTNFRYKIIGPIDDEVMNTFNGIFQVVNKKNRKTGIVEQKKEVAIAERMKYLKDQHCDIVFIRPCMDIARRNLILSGGIEMPQIIGEMLKYYYFTNNGERDYSNISKALRYLAETDPINYGVDDLEGMYWSKVGKLLYDMFTGMRMSSIWSGRQNVTGGYICAKRDGDVVAYHASVADEFRDFLVNQIAFESPSTERHNYMKIEKEGSEYYINLNMQFRFTKSEMAKLEIVEDRISLQQKLGIKYSKY